MLKYFMNNEAPKMIIQTSRFYNSLSAIFAFLLWGGWAYYVNAGADATRAFIPAIAQGTASFVITLIMVHLVAWFFNRLQGSFFQLPLSVLMTVGITATGLTALHWLVRTPCIFYTILPGVFVGLMFCCYTAYRLRKISKNHL